MSEKSNNQGRAYEFSYLTTLFEEISKVRPAKIEKNSSFYAAERAWNTLTDSEKAIYKISALAGVNTIFELEPLILDDGLDELELKIQSDDKGKEDDVYVPLLNAFKGELERQNFLFGKDIPRLMVEYLLGEFDFYKVIGIDNKKITQIQSYNLRGTLNRQGKKRKRSVELPISTLPTRIVSLEYKPDSKNTLELYLDGDWQFSFGIHNASTKVESSLKFDIQMIGMPTTIISIDCRWR